MRLALWIFVGDLPLIACGFAGTQVRFHVETQETRGINPSLESAKTWGAVPLADCVSTQKTPRGQEQLMERGLEGAQNPSSALLGKIRDISRRCESRYGRTRGKNVFF